MGHSGLTCDGVCAQLHGVPTLPAVQAVLRREGMRPCSCIDYSVHAWDIQASHVMVFVRSCMACPPCGQCRQCCGERACGGCMGASQQPALAQGERLRKT